MAAKKKVAKKKTKKQHFEFDLGMHDAAIKAAQQLQTEGKWIQDPSRHYKAYFRITLVIEED